MTLVFHSFMEESKSGNELVVGMSDQLLEKVN